VTVSNLEAVSDCEIDLATSTLTVSYPGEELDTELIGRAVRSTGHSLVIDQPRGGTSNRRGPVGPLLGFCRFLLSQRSTTLSAIAALMTLVGLGLALPVNRSLGGSTFVLAAAVLVGGFTVVQRAYHELWRSRVLGINTLMTIAVIGAVFIGEWAEAAIVVVLFSLGEALEGYAADRARRALGSLLDLAPPMATKMLAGGELQDVPVGQLLAGDRVLVRPGDRVSIDGTVLTGRSAVDQSSITGESVPVEKEPGTQVFAGTINGAGALEVKVTRLAADSTLSRMVALVRQAQSRQAPVQRFIDRFARVYTPGVAVAAALVATIPPLFFGQPFGGESGWLMRSLQMLVIACPCALVISTPVSLVSAMTNATARGVLVKGGRYLDALNRVRVIAFDKTGTLTEGRPTATDVVDVCDCGECEENCALQHAASLEAHSSHPIARALLAEAAARQVSITEAHDVTMLSGRGVEGVVNGAVVTVASHAHFDEHFPHQPLVCRRADELAAQGKTVFLVRHDDEVCGVFGVADTPRSVSREVLAELKALQITTVMLTGDNPRVAAEIGRQVGIDQVFAGLLPEEKLAAIARLAAEHQSVAMVGDGVNDAPALAQADVGIAMGGVGSAQAMESADVVLMGDDLAQLPFILALSRRTSHVITANIAFALAVKAAVFALAAGGWATLWMAIVADVGASLVVILNGMRLRWIRP
jgi:Cd2+/Zn2+-exporting ATPase